MNKETVCAIVRDLMPTYIEGLTEAETSAFVERHLTECPACREVRRGMLQITLPEEHAQSEYLEGLRRARIRRKRRMAFGIIAFLLLTAVCLLPLPRAVDMSVQATQWRAGHAEDGSEPVQVAIKGRYFDFLFFDDRYMGDVRIDGIEVTQLPDALLTVRMDAPGYLIYRDQEGKLQNVGFIVASPGMKEFVIGLTADAKGSYDWSGDDGIVLTYPASGRENAVEETRRILLQQKCTWLTEGVWEAGKNER